MNKKVVYSALVGNYDILKQPEELRQDYDYICFSNDIQEKNCGVWQIRRIPYSHRENVRMSRYVKMHPHTLLPEYEFCLWLDCNQRLTAEHYDKADMLIGNGEISAMVIHPERDCVYQESYALAGYLTGEPYKVYLQTKFLLSQKFPPRAGLYVTCCMLLKPQHPKISRFLNMWWEQCEKFSCRDQMGVMYALAQADVKPAVFFHRDYWMKYRLPHLNEKKQYTFLQRLKRFICRKFFLYRLKLLFFCHGIKDFDWQRVTLIEMQ
ncbi:MAG: DUF616 domain-containing protein [Lentisphaeria bacterium]|nr:DUF616 domain-containing protein [Lentisphaeria bacterium]